MEKQQFIFVKSRPEFSFSMKPSASRKVRLGIAKNGLLPGSLAYLAKLGAGDGALQALRNRCYGVEAEEMVVFALRQSGAMGLVDCLNKGILDMGILGADKILEAQLAGFDIVPLGESLGFGECVFRLGFSSSNRPTTFEELKIILTQGRVATSLPLTLRYLHEARKH